MPTVARWLAALAVGVAAVALFASVIAHSSDGPIGPLAGGPFRSGELVPEAKIDWESLARTPTVELQLVDPPRSRTTHIVVLDGRAYIPSGIVKVGPFVFLGQAFWKQWPDDVLEDPRVIVRSDGRLYEARAVKELGADCARWLATGAK